ncbi:CHAT domain-containing protein [Aspergillus similis]
MEDNQHQFQNAEFLDLCQALSPLLLELSEDTLNDTRDEIVNSSPSQQEWIRLKRREQAESESLDELMCMVGLEAAKAAFLQTRARVQMAQKQGKTLSRENLDIGIIGNSGTGKSTVALLYNRFLQELGVSGTAYTYQMDQTVKEKIRLELPDYTDGELLRILIAIIEKTKWKIQGGSNGRYLQMLVRICRSTRRKGFRNVHALKEAWQKVLTRQAERLQREQGQGTRLDCLLLTKADLIGPMAHRCSPAWTKLQSMIGLETVKGSIEFLFYRISQSSSRISLGLVPLHSTLNRVFLGPPGTGRTTVGRLYGQILADIGLLSSGEVVFKNPSDFIEEYAGGSRKQTREILANAKGKVLIIDNAHMLYPGGHQYGADNKEDDPRLAVIDTLVAEADNVAGNDRCVLLMGHAGQLEEMFRECDPRLARRFAWADAFRFTDYSMHQLGQILDLKMREQGIRATSQAREIVMQVLEKARGRPDFRNGSDVKRILSHAREICEKRAGEKPLPATAVEIYLEPQDFDQHYSQHLHYSRPLQATAQCDAHFRDMVGMDKIVAQLKGYQKIVADMLHCGVDPRPHIPFTFVFRGPHGTGKRSTAQRLGQIYYEMGLLSSAELVQSSVSKLITRYQGQIGKQVVHLLEQALGKVLYLEEAYRLAGAGYAKQAADELLNSLTKVRYKGKLVVVLSGYSQVMLRLMEVNPGLRSRFPTNIVFHPLSPDDCWQLLQKELYRVAIRINDSHAARTEPRQIFSRLAAAHTWANALEVKQLARVIIRHVFDRDSNEGSLCVSMQTIILELETKELDIALGEAAMVANMTGEEDPERPMALANHAEKLFQRYERTGSMVQLESAINIARSALDATQADDANRAIYLHNLSFWTDSLYERTSSIKDLDSAITNANLAAAAFQEDHHERANCLANLSNLLLKRCKRTGSLQDLQAAITNAYLAVASTPDNHPDRARCLNNLAICLSHYYEQTGGLEHLEAAITNANLAVAAAQGDHPNRAACLSTLSICLFGRYNQAGGLQDLEAAITNANLAVAATLEDNPDRAAYLSNLSNYYSSRYEQIGSVQDLEAAITNGSLAVAATAERHPERAVYLSNYSICLLRRYERTGSLQDLEAAITHASLAVAATPDDHAERAGYLNNYSTCLFRQYERTESLQYLKAAITNANVAVATTREDHLDYASCLTNLAIHLRSRYDRIGSLQDLEAAIANAKLSIATTPENHPERTSRLINLSSYLWLCHKRTGSPQDLEAATTNAYLAVAATPDNHPDRARSLNNLAICLSHRYKQSGSLQDLEAAITNASLAVAAHPDNHPDYVHYLTSLSDYLFIRCERTGNLQDLETAVQYLTVAANMPNALPLQRIQAARQAIRILQQQAEWYKASLFAENAVQLLPLVCTRYLFRDDQQYAITQTAGLAADACSIFLQLGRPEKALQTLEFGRGLILGYLIDSRSDIGQLQNDYPDIAEQYDQLRFTLSQPLNSISPRHRDQLLEQKKNAPRELEACLALIRQQKGYEQFLLEPSLSDLTSQAVEGPVVVVNITDFGAHAIIIHGKEEIRSIPLPDMIQTAKFALNDQLRLFRSVGQRGPDPNSRDIEGELAVLFSLQRSHTLYHDTESLHWLWTHCVKLVVNEIELQTLVPGVLPRIWWIGTGVASSLPFHAAGDHSHPTENTISHAISSYTPTIKALAYSRSRMAKAPAQNPTPSVFIAAMPTTPNKQPLPGVEPEVKAIQQASGHVFTVQLQKYPARKTVLDAMKDTDIIHFACHGSSDPVNPSRSHLLLQRCKSSAPAVEKLTVQHISDHVFGRARIAYLSACSTAQVTASNLSDEAIHLASAFQVAGFGHVIASLWSVDDATCARMAGYFYGYLVEHQAGALSNRLVAEALHTAVLRIRGTEHPSLWASFIHYGA